MAVIIDGSGQPVNITVAASGTVTCPVATVISGATGGGGGVSDHGALTGLADDDHPQYLNQYRGDQRYPLINHGHAASGISVAASGFNGVLSPTDVDVQTALETLDNVSFSVPASLTGITDISTPDWIQFDTTPAGADAVGRLRWNTTDLTLNLGLNSNVTLAIGQQLDQVVLNQHGSTITNGQAVYVYGAQGNRLAVKLARADVEMTSTATFGIVRESINDNQSGFVTTYGLVKNLNTLHLTEGYPVWLSATTAGELTTTRPTAPNHGVLIGFCVRQHAVNGELFVAVSNGHELDELHDVSAAGRVSGDVLAWSPSASAWVPEQRVLTSDSRLTNARTPTAHAASHQDGGSDELALDASQTTTGVFATARNGLPIGLTGSQISGVSGGYALVSTYTTTALAISTGQLLLAPAIRSGSINVLGGRVTASALTAGQSVLLVCYNASSTTGLPTTLAFSQSIVIGTGTGNFYLTGLSETIPPGAWIGVMNPSTNSGSVTFRGSAPVSGGLFLEDNSARNALVASSQGATAPSNVSTYTYSSASSATTFAAAQFGPLLAARLT